MGCWELSKPPDLPTSCAWSQQFSAPLWVFNEIAFSADNLSLVLSRQFCAHCHHCLVPESWSLMPC